MNNLKRIDFLFSISGSLILVISLIFFHDTFEFNIHNTYFVIDQLHIALALSFAFFLISLIYFSFFKFSKPLGKILGWIHYLLTTLTLFIFIFPPFRFFEPERYMPRSNPFNNSFGINELLVITFFVLILAQVIFIVNIIWTLLKRKNRRSDQ